MCINGSEKKEEQTSFVLRIALQLHSGGQRQQIQESSSGLKTTYSLQRFSYIPLNLAKIAYSSSGVVGCGRIATPKLLWEPKSLKCD